MVIGLAFRVEVEVLGFGWVDTMFGFRAPQGFFKRSARMT